jgi:hypothetical protein
MPLKKGSSRQTISQNIEEFHHGPTYQKTAAKFGKKKADAQAIAAAESEARRTKRTKRTKDHDPHSAIGHQPGKAHPF